MLHVTVWSRQAVGWSSCSAAWSKCTLVCGVGGRFGISSILCLQIFFNNRMKMHQNKINLCPNTLNAVFKTTFRNQKTSNCEHMQQYYSRFSSDNICVRLFSSRFKDKLYCGSDFCGSVEPVIGMQRLESMSNPERSDGYNSMLLRNAPVTRQGEGNPRRHSGKEQMETDFAEKCLTLKPNTAVRVPHHAVRDGFC